VSIDDFASIDDRYGLGACEEVLRAVARALTRRLRQTDLVARLRAEEFGVLLAHVDDEAMGVVADSLCRVIAACLVDLGDEVIRPQASIGGVLIDSRTGTAGSALEAASRAMLESRGDWPGQPR
jgi:diguanylate cyclase (GGDEF)-like protein